LTYLPRPAHLTLLVLILAGCSSSNASSEGSGGTSGVEDAGGDVAQDVTVDVAESQDAAQDPTIELVDLPDGTPTRQACTDSFGHGLTPKFGRLDGYLVSIVAPSSNHDCNADSDHVHLQVLMNGSVYDVAVNAGDSSSTMDPVKYMETDAPSLNGQWEEGWHPNVSFDYVGDLHVHSSHFAAMQIDELAQTVETALEDVNHISVYATGYGSDGTHLVHRNNGSTDGALVIRPLSAVPRALVFCFVDQGF